jgi:hypothetical protein
MLGSKAGFWPSLPDLIYVDWFTRHCGQRHSRSDYLAAAFPKGAVYFNHQTASALSLQNSLYLNIFGG